MYECKVILDSVSRGHRLTTLQCTFPRFILAEVNTHRMFSRNSASSRAIPVQRRIEQIEADPFLPVAFGQNKAGMQAGDPLEAAHAIRAKEVWESAAYHAVGHAKNLMDLGVHKQWANRVIETYAWHTAVISSTEWGNHDGLRCHPAASPEYQTIAKMMREARDASRPRKLQEGEWHLPYVMDSYGKILQEDIDAAFKYCADQNGPQGMTTDAQYWRVLRQVSVGRCAAVSYERQEVKSFMKDVERYANMRGGGHMSPLEHVARPMTSYEYHELFRQKEVIWNEEEQAWDWVGLGFDNGTDPKSNEGNWLHYCGNFQGWVQDRKMIPNEHDFSKIAKAA